MEEVRNELLNKFSEYLSQINNSLNEYSIDSELNIDVLEKFLNNVDDNILNFTDFNNIVILNGLNESDKNELDEFTKLLSLYRESKVFKISEEQINVIKKSDVYNRVLDKVKQDITDLRKKEEEKKKLLSYKELVDEIIKSLDVNSNTYINVNEELKEFLIDYQKLSNEDIYKILSLIGKFNIYESINIKNSFEKNKKQIKDKIQEYHLTKNELKEKFEEYGYDLDKVDEDIVNRLLMNCSLEKTEEIFKFLDEINIRLDCNKLRKNGKYPDCEKFLILFKADLSLLDKIKESALMVGMDYKELLKDHLSLLIKQGERNVNVSHGPEGEWNKDLAAGFDDFIKNLELFTEVGYDIKKLYNKSASFFYRSNKMFVRNIQALKAYGFNIVYNKGEFTLSGLTGKNPLDTFDAFLELGELDYLKYNTSSFRFDADGDIIYRLYKIIKEDKSKSYRKPYGDGYRFDKDITSLEKNAITREYVVDKFGLVKPIIVDEKTTAMLDEEVSKSDITKKVEYNLQGSELLNRIQERYSNKDNRLVYTFGNKDISKYKVWRILPLINEVKGIEDKDKLLYALTYNSLITEEELEIIKESINSLERGLN